MRLIALCGLAVAVIYGAAFAQQPTPTATPTPVADIGARISSGASKWPASSDVSERERILLERIEQLERRLNELVSRFDSAAITGKAVAPTAPLLSLTNTIAVPPADTAVSALQSTQTNQPPAPPQYAAWDIDTAQFNISPGNTYLSVELKWPKIGKWEINGWRTKWVGLPTGSVFRVEPAVLFFF